MTAKKTCKPLVSILVPCYNVEKFLRQCIDSIRNQTYKNIEIICINDGSRDSTLEILQNYAKIDSRILIISKPNSGYGHSMNIGLDKANGEYISIIESDDFVEPEMIEKLMESAIRYNLDISKGSYFSYRTSDNSNTLADTTNCPKDRVLKPIDEQDPFFLAPSIWSAIYKHEFLRKNNIRFLETPGASYQDASFAFKGYFYADRFMMINKAFVHYRVDNPGSSVNNPKKVFCVCNEYEEIWKFARKNIERYERIKEIIPLLQLNAYKWNFNRLSSSLRKIFLRRFREEFKTLNKKGLLNLKRFRYRNRVIIFELLYFPLLLKRHRKL